MTTEPGRAHTDSVPLSSLGIVAAFAEDDPIALGLCLAFSTLSCAGRGQRRMKPGLDPRRKRFTGWGPGTDASV